MDDENLRLETVMHKNIMEFVASSKNLVEGGRHENVKENAVPLIKIEKQKGHRSHESEDSLSHDFDEGLFSSKIKPYYFKKRWNSTKDLRHDDEITSDFDHTTRIQCHDKQSLNDQLKSPSFSEIENYESKSETSKLKYKAIEDKKLNRSRGIDTNVFSSEPDSHLQDDDENAEKFSHDTSHKIGQLHSMEFVNSKQRSVSLNNLRFSRSRSYEKHMHKTKQTYQKQLTGEKAYQKEQLNNVDMTEKKTVKGKPVEQVSDSSVVEVPTNTRDVSSKIDTLTNGKTPVAEKKIKLPRRFISGYINKDERSKDYSNRTQKEMKMPDKFKSKSGKKTKDSEDSKSMSERKANVTGNSKSMSSEKKAKVSDSKSVLETKTKDTEASKSLSEKKAKVTEDSKSSSEKKIKDSEVSKSVSEKKAKVTQDSKSMSEKKAKVTEDSKSNSEKRTKQYEVYSSKSENRNKIEDSRPVSEMKIRQSGGSKSKPENKSKLDDSRPVHKEEKQVTKGTKSATEKKTKTSQDTRQSKKKTANNFTVDVHMSEHILENYDIKSYILNRMGARENIQFEVTNAINKPGKALSAEVSLLFPSKIKAMKAVDLLNKSNRNAEKKIICSYDSDKEIQDAEDRKWREQAEFNKSAERAVETAKQALDKQELLIRDAAAKLENIEKSLSTRKGVSLDVFNALLCEQKAREDKVNELKQHRKEFQRFLNSMNETLTTMDPSEKEKMYNLRKSLGTECHRLETALPMYARRDDILTTIGNNQVSILLGETGSGKSTQLVQYLYQAGYAQKGIIACTQPRKIAAISLAKHVSSELGSRVGKVVGYQVGMKTEKSSDTKIMFMTDHILLNECLKDENLSQFSCVIIDEAHERSIYTDLLLGMLKKCLSSRPDLKIVITSATIKPDIFVSYFGGEKVCPVLKVSGRTFPVETVWNDDVYGDPFPEDYERKAVSKAIEVHTTVPAEAGDILVFVTSPTESEKCCQNFSRRVTDQNFKCLQLHGKLKQEEQQLVFEPGPKGVRKIVFATNSAETSITIPGIKFVIDTGVVREMRYDAKKKMNCLSVVPVSQSSADQRKGRAGRTAPGICYRLYSEADFYQMEKNNKPEILRVNLGQALLKLLQLKVDPLSFDFVESPDKDHMTAVMEMLCQLGAVKGMELTDLGKWIANLPLEPRLGVLVKNGIELEVPVEAMVVATCTTAGSVFYRSGSLEEKKKSDLKKLKFCHPGGDLLTALNVYREWNGVHEGGKGKWCVNNSVNGKTMKGIREAVKEIIDILKKEMKLYVKYELCPLQKADTEIQRLLIKCMTTNLCFYLGHERAGYITTDLHQHVQIHPSSSLVCLGQQPKWIVYEQILKTTDDFVTNISPVSEDDMEEFVLQRQTYLDREYLNSREVSQICKIPVGKYVFWKFVGPFHKGRKDMEELMRIACNDSLVVIEADKQKGEIALYTPRQFGAFADGRLKSALNHIPEVLRNEAKEIPIGNDKSGVRAVIGPGGGVVDILMPSEYRTLNIKQKPFCRYDLMEEDVRSRFSGFGPIDQIWQAKGKKQNIFWGKVTFLHWYHAIEAVADINDDENELIEVVPVMVSTGSKSNTEYTVRLSWCRRLGRGIAYVYLENPEDEEELLDTSPITIGDKTVDIRRAKRDNLMLSGLSAYVSEDEIREALADVLDVVLPPNSTRFKVIVPRSAAITSPSQMDRVRDQLEAEVLSASTKGHFRINMKGVQDQTARYTAFVSFKDLNDCENIMDMCDDGRLRIGSAPVDASMDLKTSVVVQKKIFDVVKSDINSLTQKFQRKRSSTSIKRKEIKSGNTVLDICSSSPRKLAKTMALVHEIVDGNVLGCETTPRLYHLFTKRNRQVVANIERSTRTLIFMDQRNFTATVHGLVELRQIAIHELKLFLESLKDVEELEQNLKGEGNPPGVMKELIALYDTDLKGLTETADLAKVSLNVKLHKVTMVGTKEAIAKGCELIQDVKEKASDRTQGLEAELPDCPICMCPVELSQLYRLEYCGHGYCKDCVKSLILNGLTDKKFPIQCAAEECGKDIVIRDINIQIKEGAFTSSKLATAAVDCLVAKDNTTYHYCLTPNCEMVYKVTSAAELFKCPLCLCHICTACHIQYHDGMSCDMYKSAKSESGSVKKWVQEKPKMRIQCPKCDIGIEKIEGCNNMHCKACGSHICWLCLRYFPTSRQCYDHIHSKHKGKLFAEIPAGTAV